jgi:hypothetical protein
MFMGKTREKLGFLHWILFLILSEHSNAALAWLVLDLKISSLPKRRKALLGVPSVL